MASDAFVAIIACGKAEAKQGHELRAKQGQIFFPCPWGFPFTGFPGNARKMSLGKGG
jgi:hypothetical protein